MPPIGAGVAHGQLQQVVHCLGDNDIGRGVKDFRCDSGQVEGKSRKAGRRGGGRVCFHIFLRGS